MKVTVCIGSSCHIKGSRQVVEQLQQLVADNGLKEKVDLGGTFRVPRDRGAVLRDRDQGQGLRA